MGTVPDNRGLSPLFGSCGGIRGAMDDCLFCKIVAGELPSTRVYEDDRVVAIMDIFPATRGHALVISRAHAADVHEVA